MNAEIGILKSEMSSCRAIDEKSRLGRWVDIGCWGQQGRPLSASPITRASSNALHCLAPRLPASSPLKYKLKAHVISRSLSGFIEGGQDTPTEVMTIDNLSKKFLAIGEYCGVNHLSVRHIILRKRASPEREICWKPWVCIWTASEFDIEPFCRTPIGPT